MQFPIVIGLRRSYFQAGFIVASGLGAVLLTCFAPWAVWVRSTLCLLVLAFVALALVPARGRVQGLVLTREGVLHLRLAGVGNVVQGRLLPGATVHPWLTVLRIAHATGSLTLLLTPECLAADDFRRLRVWLRWQASFADVVVD